MSLYKLSYSERKARVAEFYDCVKNDAPNVHKIQDYKLYNDYKSYIDYMNDFNNQELYEKYKNDIINMFGVACKRFTSFKRQFIQCCNDTIKRLQDVYYKVKSSKTDVKINYDIKQLDDEYNDVKTIFLNKMTESLSESEKLTYASNIESYVLYEFEMIRNYVLTQ